MPRFLDASASRSLSCYRPVMTARARARHRLAVALAGVLPVLAAVAMVRAAEAQRPPGVPPITVGVTLAGLLDRVEDAMRQAGHGERAAVVDAAAEIALATSRARHAYHDGLARAVGDASSSVRQALVMLEVAVARLERRGPGDTEEATKAARQVAGAATLARNQPSALAYHPRLVVQRLPQGTTRLGITGSFPQAQERDFRPYLMVGEVAVTPADAGPRELVFEVPHRLLRPALAGRIGVTTLAVVVPFKTNAFTRKREAEFLLPVGALPERIGTATLAVEQRRSATETETVRTASMEQSAGGVDRRDVLHCGPEVPAGWTVRAESVRIVVERFRGTPGPRGPGARWWHGPPTRLAPAVCVPWTTLARRAGVDGAVSFRYEYVVTREAERAEWTSEAIPLAWGQSVVRPVAGPWKVTFTAFDGPAQVLWGPGASTPPYLTLTVLADGAVRLETAPAPDTP